MSANTIPFKIKDKITLSQVTEGNDFYKTVFGPFLDDKIKELSTFLTTVGVVMGIGEYQTSAGFEQVVTAEFVKDEKSYFLNIPASDVAIAV